MSEAPTENSKENDPDLTALEAIYGVGRVSSIYQSQPPQLQTPLANPDVQDLQQIYGQHYYYPSLTSPMHTQPAYYSPSTAQSYPASRPPSLPTYPVLPTHSYPAPSPLDGHPSYHSNDPSPVTPFHIQDGLAVPPIQQSHSSNTSLESSPAVSTESLETSSHKVGPSDSDTTKESSQTPTEKSQLKGIRKMMSMNTMSEDRQKELQDIEAELRRLYMSIGVASYQELKEKIKLALDKKDTLERERDNRIKMRSESRSVLADLNRQNKQDIATMKACRSRALELTEEIKKGNEQLKEYKRHINRYRSDAVRHATNADREYEELQRREPHHERLKSTFEDSVQKYQLVSSKTEQVKSEIRALEEFRQNEVKMIELKNLEAEMDRLSLIQESQQFDKVMETSFNELNQLLQVCITEQHALDELYASLDDPEIQQWAEGDEMSAM